MVEGNEKTAYLSLILWKMEIKVWRNNLFTKTQLANGSPGRALTLECADPISSCKEKEKCVYHSNPNRSIPLISSCLLNWKIEFLIFSLPTSLILPSFLVHCFAAARWEGASDLQPSWVHDLSLPLSLSLLYIALAFLVFNSQRHKETSDIIDNYLLILTWSPQP